MMRKTKEKRGMKVLMIRKKNKVGSNMNKNIDATFILFHIIYYIKVMILRKMAWFFL